jgi:hypothetical protein
MSSSYGLQICSKTLFLDFFNSPVVPNYTDYIQNEDSAARIGDEGRCGDRLMEVMLATTMLAQDRIASVQGNVQKYCGL